MNLTKSVYIRAVSFVYNVNVDSTFTTYMAGIMDDGLIAHKQHEQITASDFNKKPNLNSVDRNIRRYVLIFLSILLRNYEYNGMRNICYLPLMLRSKLVIRCLADELVHKMNISNMI